MKQDRLPYLGLTSDYIYEKMCARLEAPESEESLEVKDSSQEYHYKFYTSQEAQKEVEQAGLGWKIIAKAAFAGKKWIKKIPVIGPWAISIKESFLHRSGMQKDVSYLLSYDINEQIRESYRVFLKREPDTDGFLYYQGLLCTGMPREALLYLFSTSDEFENRFEVKHLKEYKKQYRRYCLKQRIKRVPILSHTIYLIQLPKRIQRLELEHGRCLADLRELTQLHQSRIDSLHQEIWELHHQIGLAAEKHQNLEQSLDTAVDQLNHRLECAEHVDELQAQRLDKIELTALPVFQKVDTLETKVNELSKTAMRYLSEDLPDVYVNSGILGHASYLKHIGVSKENCVVSMDSFYEYLGKLFRDNTDALKDHMAVYIPYIQRAFCDTDSKTFLDVGCGEGAFVDQLQGCGIIAKGVDVNEESVKEGLALGRNIHLSDGLEYMQTLENDTLSGVSMFQVAEHMTFEMLFAMAKEMYRVIAGNGVVLIETINSWCYRKLGSFHIDPSHITLPSSDSIKLMLEMIGFQNVQIMFYAPIGSHAIKGEITESNYEGFCVIGRKASEHG